MAKAIFDIAGKLDLLFRIARIGSKTFTFVDADAAPYSLSGLVFELNIKENPGDVEPVFQLTDGDGLTLGDNTIQVDVDATQTDLPEKLYFWELYETTTTKTWLCGSAYFISRDPSSENDATEVTVRTEPDVITVTISGVSSTSGSSETQTSDQLTILGDGLETPYYVAGNQFDAYGAADVVAKEGLLREWDNTENKFPDSGGSGVDEDGIPDGSIERHNRFIGTGTGAWVVRVGGPTEDVNEGAEFIAKIDDPGNDPANWWFRG
jgi:hypothetical protein